jgi:hypothetical protein
MIIFIAQSAQQRLRQARCGDTALITGKILSVT